ncbi:hypothetical protein Trydic_g8768 [Trypoxylus dichotomus]
MQLFLLLLSISLCRSADYSENDTMPFVPDVEDPQPQPPPEQPGYNVFVYEVVADGKSYTAIAVNGRAVVTNNEIMNAKRISICTRSRMECTTSEGIIKIPSYDGILFLKAAISMNSNEWFDRMVFHEDPMAEARCYAVSIAHKPILVNLTSAEEAECEHCGTPDGVFCEGLIFGIIITRKLEKNCIVVPYGMLLEYVEKHLRGENPEHAMRKYASLCCYVRNRLFMNVIIIVIYNVFYVI